MRTVATCIAKAALQGTFLAYRFTEEQLIAQVYHINYMDQSEWFED